MPQFPLTQGGPGELPAIRPVASPLDTFVQPAAGSSLAQLASALSSVAPSLSQIGAELGQRDAQKQAEMGEQYAADVANSKDMWSQAIQDGKIAPAQSPWFRLAAKQKLGQVAADRFNTTLQQSIAQLGDGATPDAFEAAVSKARGEFLKASVGKLTGDLSFMKGFDSVAEQQISSARRTFAMENAKNYELQASAAYFNASHAMARTAIEAGSSVDEIAAKLNGEALAWSGVNPAVSHGAALTGVTLSKLNADVVFSLMRSTRNVKLATELASKIKDGDGVLLDSAEFQDRLESETDHVTADARQAESDAYTKEQRAQADATDQAQETIYQRWKQGGAVNTDDIEAQLKSVGVKDPHATATALLDKMPELDPTNYVGFRSRVSSGKYPAQAELDLAARTHRISASQYSSLVGDIEQAKNAERSFALQGAATTEAVWSHPAVRAIEDSIRAAAKSKAKVDPLTGNIISYTGFTDNDVQQAVNEGKLFMANWLSQNWSKYGSGNSALLQAGIAWRGFAASHGILTPDEVQMGSKVLPADPGAASSIQRNAASSRPQATATPPKPGSTGKQTGDFSRAEIHQMRSDFAQFSRMSVDQRKAWLMEPRHRAVLSQLGDPPLAELGEKLLEAERSKTEP